jgi:Tfp pilus assembly protein PilN
MPAKSVAFKINLVPKDPFFQSPLGRTLKWALSVGRYIVIFTELIVIISFATRFSLDRQVTDLNDSINQKASIIDSYGTLEADVRLAQQKIENFQQISQQANIIDIFPKLTELTPSDVRLENLVIRGTSVNIEGVTRSQNALNVLITNLQLSPDIYNLTVDKIETNQQDLGGGFRFRIRFEKNPQ